MKIDLRRKNDAFHLEAKNEVGLIVNIDASESIGGEGKGVRPMELVATGLAGCSSIDVLSILKKQRQEVVDFGVQVDAKRKDEVPSVFDAIHLGFWFEGELDEDKVKKAIELSINKYCSVAKMIDDKVNITYEFKINRNE